MGWFISAKAFSLDYVIASNAGLAPSPLGGLQGGASLIFGIPYSPSGIIDRSVESFGGPHDYLNAFHYYDEFGNNVANGASEFWNYFNLLPSAPLGLATLNAQYDGVMQTSVSVYRAMRQLQLTKLPK